MQIIGTEVTEAQGANAGFLVEFLGDGESVYRCV